MPRLACLYVPAFPLAARLRGRPQGGALAIVEGTTLVAVNEAARRLGVSVGSTLPQARALVPSLPARERDRVAEDSAAQALREAADAFSPVVEEGRAPGLLYLDLGDGGKERRLAAELARRAEAVGLPARVGVAGSRAAARLAAWAAVGEPVVVEKGRDREFLAPQPLARLRPSERTRETLGRWGLKTMGDLARLEEGEVLARLGAEGLELSLASRGVDRLPLVASPVRLAHSEGVSLDWGLEDVESLLAAARGPFERLAERLSAMGLGTRKLGLTLGFDPSGHESRVLELAAPTRDVRTWLGQLRMEVLRMPPRAPVFSLSITARGAAPRGVQLTLFGPPAQSPDAVGGLLARLAALLGAGRLGSPRPVDSHRPERYALIPYAPPPVPESRDGGEAEVLGTALRTLRPFVELEVLETGEGRPFAMASMEPGFSLGGRVRQASGPWRLEDGWWTDEPAARDYWDVELADGALWRVFKDRRSGRWYADGLHD